MFHRRSVAEQHELFARLAQNNPKVSLPMEGIAVSSSQTLFTEIKDGLYQSFIHTTSKHNAAKGVLCCDQIGLLSL